MAGGRVIWMALPAVASAALGVWAFHPARAEAVDRPTRLAAFLWTRHPAFDNPLPEIFAERLQGLDENRLPVATPGVGDVVIWQAANQCFVLAIDVPPRSLCDGRRTPLVERD